MTDLRTFEMAARREEERRKQPTLLDFEEEADKLRRIVEERRKAREEEAREQEQRRAAYEEAKRLKEAEDIADMERLLSAGKKLMNEVGRQVDSFYINPGGEVITVHRPTESIRVNVGNISSRQTRLIALRMVIEHVIG